MSRRLVFTAVASLLFAACHAPAGKILQAGDLTLALALDPDPPRTGDNALIVGVKDAAGHPVEGAKVSLVWDMPAMGSMPEMSGGGETTSLGEGRYRVVYPLAMAGDWSVTVMVEASGHPPAEVRLKVSPPRPGFTVVGGAGGAAGASEGPKPFEVDRARQQRIGLTWATVLPRMLTRSLRATGTVQVDERSLAEVNLKYEAYLETLFVGETGKNVRAGDPLFSLYSPDLLAAEEDLLQAEKAKAGGAPGAEAMIGAAARRLRLWDLSPAQIEAMEKSGKADGKLTVSSPASGVVLEKMAVAGLHAMPGMTLYRIGNLGKIWVQADLFERDAPFLSLGEEATIALPALGSAPLEGRVTFVAPVVDEKTRTLRARIELANPGLSLKPGMFADVHVDAPVGEKLAVPDRALLLSGEHRYAFLRRGNDRVQAREVKTGVEAGGFDEVVAGLSSGDQVVLDGTFLISSEAALRGALPHWTGDGQEGTP